MTRARPGPAALSLEGVSRSYAQGRRRLRIFADLGLTLFPGEIVALVGPSGSGKSSLLHIAGLLEKPDAGRVVISGRDCSGLNDKARARMRRYNIGFVYQFHHLLGEFSALENVVMPQLIAGVDGKPARRRARDLLERVGMAERLGHRPGKLSGGEQQRVAIARALANAPGLLLADEPTGNLDPETAVRVFELLLGLVRSEGMAALIATHNRALASAMDRYVELSAGTLIERRPVASRSAKPASAHR